MQYFCAFLVSLICLFPRIIRPDGVPPLFGSGKPVTGRFNEVSNPDRCNPCHSLDVGGKRDKCFLDIPADSLCAFCYVVQFSGKWCGIGRCVLERCSPRCKKACRFLKDTVVQSIGNADDCRCQTARCASSLVHLADVVDETVTGLRHCLTDGRSHLAELLVNRRALVFQRLDDRFSSNLPILTQRPQLADSHAHAVSNGFCQRRSLFHDRVEFFATQSTRCKRLSKLRQCGGGGCA